MMSPVRKDSSTYVKMMMVAFMMIPVDGGHLHVNIGREFHGVVVVQGDHLLGRGVGVDVSPSIPLGGRIIRHSSFFSSSRWYLRHPHRIDFQSSIWNLSSTYRTPSISWKLHQDGIGHQSCQSPWSMVGYKASHLSRPIPRPRDRWSSFKSSRATRSSSTWTSLTF